MAGQTQPDRTTRYNSKYWNAAVKDINKQAKGLKFPNRPNTAKPLKLRRQGSQPIETGPYMKGNKGINMGPKQFGNKKTLPEGGRNR